MSEKVLIVAQDPICHSSSSSTTIQKSSLLNGLIPSTHRLSDGFANVPSSFNLNSNSRRIFNEERKLFDRIRWIFVVLFLTFLFAFLLLVTILFSTIFLQNRLKKSLNSINETSIHGNETNSLIQSYFGCIFLFNLFFFLLSTLIHLFIYRKHSRTNRTKAAFFR